MIFLKDGSTATGGFAPYANRFNNGGYIHGVPTNAPAKGIIEYSYTLGTTPRSHMCVRQRNHHMPSLFLTGHLLMRQLYLFWNRNVRNFAPIYLVFHLCTKSFLFLFLFLFPFSNVSTRTSVSEEMTDMAIPENELTDGEVLFEEMNLGGIVNFPAFRQAVQGYNKIEQKKKPVLTLIDFTKPSTEKRLFVSI